MRATSTPWPLPMPSASAPTTDLGKMLLITSTSSLLRKACSSTENGSGRKLMSCKPSGAWRGVMTNCFLRAPTVVVQAPVARLDALPAPLDVAAEVDDDGAAAGGDVAGDGAGDVPAARVLPLSAVSPAAGVGAGLGGGAVGGGAGIRRRRCATVWIFRHVNSFQSGAVSPAATAAGPVR